MKLVLIALLLAVSVGRAQHDSFVDTTEVQWNFVGFMNVADKMFMKATYYPIPDSFRGLDSVTIKINREHFGYVEIDSLGDVIIHVNGKASKELFPLIDFCKALNNIKRPYARDNTIRRDER